MHSPGNNAYSSLGWPRVCKSLALKVTRRCIILLVGWTRKSHSRRYLHRIRELGMVGRFVLRRPSVLPRATFHLGWIADSFSVSLTGVS